MKVVGVTGNIGCGKSTVSRLFQKFVVHIHILDADKIAHECLEKNKNFIKDKFNFLSDNSLISKKELAEIVFNDKNLLDELCKVIHPCVIENICTDLERIKSLNSQILVVIDCPLLFEMNLEKIVDFVVVVTTSLDTRVFRLKGKGYTKEQIMKREECQLPLKSKVKKADFIINNDESLFYTQKQIKEVYKKLSKLI